MAIDCVGGIGTRGVAGAAALEAASEAANGVAIEAEEGAIQSADGLGGAAASEASFAPESGVSTEAVGGGAGCSSVFDSISSPTGAVTATPNADQLITTSNLIQTISQSSAAQGGQSIATANGAEGASRLSGPGATIAATSFSPTEGVGGPGGGAGYGPNGLDGVDDQYLLNLVAHVLEEGLPGVCTNDEFASLSERLLEIIRDDPGLATSLGGLLRDGSLG